MHVVLFFLFLHDILEIGCIVRSSCCALQQQISSSYLVFEVGKGILLFLPAFVGASFLDYTLNWFRPDGVVHSIVTSLSFAVCSVVLKYRSDMLRTMGVVVSVDETSPKGFWNKWCLLWYTHNFYLLFLKSADLFTIFSSSTITVVARRAYAAGFAYLIW